MTDQILQIPRRLQPIPLIVSLTDNTRDRLTYSRDFLRSLYTHTFNQALTAEIEGAFQFGTKHKYSSKMNC